MKNYIMSNVMRVMRPGAPSMTRAFSKGFR